MAFARMLSVVLSLWLVGCVADSATTPAPIYATAGPTAFTPEVYRLGPGDKVKVRVFQEDDLSGEFSIGGDGAVNMPLIGSVPAAGLTTSELGTALRQQLGHGYIQNPKVAVEVFEYRPFFITGEVKNGGQYPYQIGLSVQQAVAMAGGYTYRGKQNVVYIRHEGEDDEIRYSLTRRIPVHPGDNLRIPERFF